MSDTFIHPLADVHPSAVIGQGVVIWAFAQIMMGVQLSDNVSIGSGAYVGAYTSIGEYTRVGQGAHITDHMTVGRRCFIAPHAILSNDKRPRVLNAIYKRESPIMEDEVSLGVNSTICPGVRLGRGCMIGAGAVVTKNVPPFETWAGNPAAKLVRTEDEAPGLQGL